MSVHHGFIANRFFIFVLLFISLVSLSDTRDTHTVDKWAERIGSDLWDLADAVAQPKELLKSYKNLNARVEDKAGDELIEIIGESVGRMLTRKMDAVRCILKVAEAAAENFNDTQLNISLHKVPVEIPPDMDISYYSGKYSNVTGEPLPNLPESIKNQSHFFREMELEADSHFYNIPVNTEYSAVHVPTNIFDLAFETNVAIQWSKALDEVFRQNYRSDPALSWQYFGSSTGILRLYPAMQWRTEDSNKDPTPDLYDCRLRSWFIESATCSKDMVILLDISGSMQGSAFAIGTATAGEILGTLSNNDFVTVLVYNNETYNVVPCFEGMLVQATPENIAMFKKGMAKFKKGEPADLTKAFDAAFDILERYRDEKGCNSTVPCTQTIMLVTDNVPGNLTEVFDRRNSMENGTHIPVRIFTYLLGRDVTNVEEIQWMACTNRGYYSHVHTLSEVREQVLKYIDVIARPLVLQEVRHPLIWTHAYADISLGNEDEELSALKKTTFQEYRLLTSVSIPAYDRKKNRDNTTKYADLLGVAGTDVPLEEINRLTLPFKLGVNGYAFIVSNNGYVILHPDLRPASNGQLKPNYNSIDLTEVEIIDDDTEPRQPAETVLKLREALVNHWNGSIRGVPVKFHYDDWRRVTVENRDYFYAPLPKTPFGIAIALPDYGTTWIKVGDEIAKNKHMNIKILDFFIGDRWRVHPSWVYCRYHYLEGHEFTSRENETRYFLGALDRDDWHWAEQYEDPDKGKTNVHEVDEDGEIGKLNCGRENLGREAYYCNKELMQLLVFDAKATNQSFNEEFKYDDDYERDLGDAYGVFLRFVGTQSGLTRWQNIREHPALRKNPSTKPTEFGDLHNRAIGEPWYKGAIFQHRVNPESISLTVPSGAGMDAIVTVAQGIFPRDGGKEAPAAVVGFQMPMISFYNRFINITSSSLESDLSCSDRSTDCYLIDQNGYVVVCDAHDDTGKFMGVIDGAVMGSMIEQGLYKAVNIYDYQAFCTYDTIVGAASFLENPFHHITQILSWFFARLLWLTSQFIEIPGTEGWMKKHPSKEEDSPDPPPPPRKETHNYSCDQKRVLYILQNFTDGNVITEISTRKSRPFFAQKVPHTNLVLVIVKTSFSSPYERLIVEPWELPPSSYGNDSTQAPCHKLNLNKLPRRGLGGCYTDHILEKEIKDCGAGSKTYLKAQASTVILILLTTFLSTLKPFTVA